MKGERDGRDPSLRGEGYWGGELGGRLALISFHRASYTLVVPHEFSNDSRLSSDTCVPRNSETFIVMGAAIFRNFHLMFWGLLAPTTLLSCPDKASHSIQELSGRLAEGVVALEGNGRLTASWEPRGPYEYFAILDEGRSSSRSLGYPPASMLARRRAMVGSTTCEVTP